MSNKIVLLFGCTNIQLHHDKQYLIEIEVDSNNTLFVYTSYGPRNKLKKRTKIGFYEQDKIIKLIKSRYSKGYILEQVDGCNVSNNNLNMIDPGAAIGFLMDGLRNLHRKLMKRTPTKDVTSTPVVLICECEEEAELEFSPNW